MLPSNQYQYQRTEQQRAPQPHPDTPKDRKRDRPVRDTALAKNSCVGRAFVKVLPLPRLRTAPFPLVVQWPGTVCLFRGAQTAASPSASSSMLNMTCNSSQPVRHSLHWHDISLSRASGDEGTSLRAEECTFRGVILYATSSLKETTSKQV